MRVAVVNEWTAAQKLRWLCVRLTGRAQRAFHLSRRLRTPQQQLQLFEPKSRMTHYQAEFETRKKKHSEGWADLAEDLLTLADKAFPDLQVGARERL